MPDLSSVSPIVLLLIAGVISAAASLVPASPVEPMLVGLAAATPEWLLVPLIAVVTAGSLVGKAVVYLAGRAAPRLVPPKQQARVERLRLRLEGRPRTQWLVVFTSSATSVPPFYLITAIAGALRLPPYAFFVAAGLGRAVRFSVLLSLPRLLGFGA